MSVDRCQSMSLCSYAPWARLALQQQLAFQSRQRLSPTATRHAHIWKMKMLISPRFTTERQTSPNGYTWWPSTSTQICIAGSINHQDRSTSVMPLTPCNLNNVTPCDDALPSIQNGAT
eukprot:260694-Chlamydomonas_euryale.AAC.3